MSEGVAPPSYLFLRFLQTCFYIVWHREASTEPMQRNIADATRKALNSSMCSMCICMCARFSACTCVQRSVHNSRTSAPREIDFCLLRSIGFIKRKTKEVVRNMNRREMYPISVDKGKTDSSTLFRLCLLHWLPWA